MRSEIETVRVKNIDDFIERLIGLVHGTKNTKLSYATHIIDRKSETATVNSENIKLLQQLYPKKRFNLQQKLEKTEVFQLYNREWIEKNIEKEIDFYCLRTGKNFKIKQSLQNLEYFEQEQDNWIKKTESQEVDEIRQSFLNFLDPLGSNIEKPSSQYQKFLCFHAIKIFFSERTPISIDNNDFIIDPANILFSKATTQGFESIEDQAYLYQQKRTEQNFKDKFGTLEDCQYLTKLVLQENLLKIQQSARFESGLVISENPQIKTLEFEQGDIKDISKSEIAQQTIFQKAMANFKGSSIEESLSSPVSMAKIREQPRQLSERSLLDRALQVFKQYFEVNFCHIENLDFSINHFHQVRGNPNFQYGVDPDSNCFAIKNSLYQLEVSSDRLIVYKLTDRGTDHEKKMMVSNEDLFERVFFQFTDIIPEIESLSSKGLNRSYTISTF